MLRLSTGMRALYVYDGTPGSPIALITSSGQTSLAYDYDPYGVPSLKKSGELSTTQNPYLFAGTGVQDRTTGWIHYANRYYNPKTGTWTQQDSYEVAEGVIDIAAGAGLVGPSAGTSGTVIALGIAKVAAGITAGVIGGYLAYRYCP
jgi:RHS repeat-associated protein